MDKFEYLKLALKNKLYERMDWIISIFAIIKRDNNDLNYSYQVFQDVTGFYFADPTQENKLIKLTGVTTNQPLFTFLDKLTVDKTICLNIENNEEVVLGELLVNLILLVNAFGNKIPYVKGKFSLGKIEEIIAKKLETDVEDSSQKDANKIYVSEYIKFVNSIGFLEDFSQLCVHAGSERVLTSPPGVVELRNKLIEENKDNLHDPEVIANIEDQLIKYDAEYLKGDEAAETFVTGSKMRNIVRKKLFLMQGASESIVDTASVDPIFTSLEEGWEVNDMPKISNTVRSGSFYRGAQTQLGGVITKMLLRATSNIKLQEQDCGTKIGINRFISDMNYKKLIGIYIIENNKTVLVENEEQAKQYVNRTVVKRSPMYCKTNGTDLCIYCVGTKLSNSPNGISLAVSDYGSAFLKLFLKKMHGSSLSVAKMDLQKSLT